MNKTPTICVVIPLYNKAPHIVKTIESVLAQTSPPDEIIVVDDGSTDGGARLVVPYTKENRVRLLKQSNAGESCARNRGISETTCEYVAFLDADDFWLPHHIDTLRRLIAMYPQASLFSTAHVIERDGKQYRPRSSYRDGSYGLVDDFFARYAYGLSLINSITACAKRQDILEIGGFPIGVRRGPDIICWINMALKYHVAHAEIVTAVYYQDAVNRTDRLREASPPGSLTYMVDLFKGNGLNASQRKGMVMLFDRIAFFSAAGFKANGDASGVEAILRLAWDAGRYRLSALLVMLRMVPGMLLQVAKRFRHPSVADRDRTVPTSQPAHNKATGDIHEP